MLDSGNPACERCDHFAAETKQNNAHSSETDKSILSPKAQDDGEQKNGCSILKSRHRDQSRNLKEAFVIRRMDADELTSINVGSSSASFARTSP